jgi:hypothetical protein
MNSEKMIYPGFLHQFLLDSLDFGSLESSSIAVLSVPAMGELLKDLLQLSLDSGDS